MSFGVASLTRFAPTALELSRCLSPFSHIDETGRLTMVDGGGKALTDRTATASGVVFMRPETLAAIRARTTPKGDPLEPARLAGIMAAKQTDRLIPLCHTLPLSYVNAELTLAEDRHYGHGTGPGQHRR